MDVQDTITITFGDQSENHVGMQKIGELAEEGFTKEELLFTKQKFESKGVQCELIDLNSVLCENDNNGTDEACILIVRNGVDCLLGNEGKSIEMYEEQKKLDVDKKAFMYGRVVNKNARHNLCFSEQSQEPDYQNGKGRIISFDEIILTKQIREQLGEWFGEKAHLLQAEANYYYDINKCGIGYHGDAERKKVIAVRLGASMRLRYHWFKESKPLAEPIEVVLNNGDMYVMNEKATGFDWKKKKILTLRHAAGCDKFLKIVEKKKKK